MVPLGVVLSGILTCCLGTQHAQEFIRQQHIGVQIPITNSTIPRIIIIALIAISGSQYLSFLLMYEGGL